MSAEVGPSNLWVGKGLPPVVARMCNFRPRVRVFRGDFGTNGPIYAGRVSVAGYIALGHVRKITLEKALALYRSALAKGIQGVTFTRKGQ